MSGKTYKPEVLFQAVKRSVKGEAGRILMRLGINTTLGEIVAKFQSVYGVVDTKEGILAQFFSAKQSENEDVTAWPCRLEDILSRAVEKGIVPKKD